MNVPINFEIKDNSPQFLSALKNAVERGLEAIGMTAEGHAKDKITQAPAVDTGRLRNSITHAEDMSDNSVYIGTNVEYGVWIEVGTGIYASDGQGRKDAWAFKDKNGKWHLTRGVKPVHYLQDAATNHSEEYKKLMKESLENA